MRILLLNQFYPPDVAPTGQYLHDLARRLVERGHEVEVVCSQRSYDGGSRFLPGEIIDGVRVTRLPAFGFGRRGFIGKLADYMSFYLLLALRLLTVRHPDLILSLTTQPYVGLLGKLAAKLRRSEHAHWIMDLYPDVLAAHGSMRSQSLCFRFLAWLTRMQLRGSKLKLTLGEFMNTRVSAYVDSRESSLTVVPLWSANDLTPCVQETVMSIRDQRQWKTSDLVLMYSGNMGLGHRFQEFLNAADRLGPVGPLWVFAGGGKRRAEVETFAKAHPHARITMLPYAPREQLRESLCAADVHLVSQDSAWQGLIVPSKLQSIFAVGRPVVFVGSRDNEIANWIEKSGAGWIAPENDVDVLIAAVRDAGDITERTKRGLAAQQFAEAWFQADASCTRIVQLLESAVN